MSLAAAARDAARDHPFLLFALRAGVVNYRAAAEFLDVGDGGAVAAALRRYAGELPPCEPANRAATVRMRSGVGVVEESAAGRGDEAVEDASVVLSVGGLAVVAGAGDMTAVVAAGDVDAAALSAVLDRLTTANVVVDAAAVGGGTLVVVVPRRDGPAAIRHVESALSNAPAR